MFENWSKNDYYVIALILMVGLWLMGQINF